MDFKEIEILDWYDNIINAFGYTESNSIIYCNLLAINKDDDVKIYVAIDVKYFEQPEKIKEIIRSKSFLANEKELHNLLNSVRKQNEAWLIKTIDLIKDQSVAVKYRNNFDWNKGIFYEDYAVTISKASEIDDWWGFW